MAKRCVYLSHDAEWDVSVLRDLAKDSNIEGLSLSAILAAALDALTDCPKEKQVEYLKWAKESRWLTW